MAIGHGQPFLHGRKAAFHVAQILGHPVDLTVQPPQHFQGQIFRFGCHNLQ